MITVYYIDDEPLLCELFAEDFESPEIKIVTFTDHLKLLEETKLKPPDIIFLDYRLPKINGEQIAIKMNNDIPKYLITGDLNNKTTYKFNGVIQKPYNEADIKLILNKFL